jgi:CheY-like chemotaxis protein
MRAGIIDSTRKAKYWEKVLGRSFECKVVADVNKLPECDIIIVSDAYCSGSIATVIENIRASAKLCNTPAAAVTSEGSCENQEILIALGFDDVIRLPICNELMMRRAKALATVVPNNDIHRSVNIESLMKLKDGESGAYCVRSVDFTNIFRFVLRSLERSQKDTQMLVFSLSAHKRSSADKWEQVMNILSEEVRKCLRRGDISSVCSEDRILALLIGADDEGGHLVAERVVNSFYSECDDDSFRLTYDVREVRALGH